MNPAPVPMLRAARTGWIPPTFGVFGIAVLLAAKAIHVGAVAPRHPPRREVVTVPFALAMGTVIVEAVINGSRPLSFVLDSGANTAIVRTAVARELGLELTGQVRAGGVGAGTQVGSRVKGAAWTLPALHGFSQPVAIALPMPELPAALGRPIDGIIGGEFIRQFVVELDYQARQLRLHPPDGFVYTGPGESLPLEFTDITHPTIRASLTIGDRTYPGRFMFDIGARTALALHSPFVTAQHLLREPSATIRAIGGAGAGGRATGRLGRIDGLQIGSFAIRRPIVMFSQDTAGAFANGALEGNIGARVAMRFKLFFDYRRRRLILERSPEFEEPFDWAFSGVAIRASGADYRTFRIVDVLEDSPASGAGLRIDDVIVALDGVPADRLTLATITEMFEKPRRYAVRIRRGDQTIDTEITPARLI